MNLIITLLVAKAMAIAGAEPMRFRQTITGFTSLEDFMETAGQCVTTDLKPFGSEP